MIVHQDECGRTDLQAATEDLAGLEQGSKRRPLAEALVAQEAVARIEKQHANALAWLVSEHREEIVSKRVRRREHRALAEPGPEHVELRFSNRGHELCKPAIRNDRADRLGSRAEERPQGFETAEKQLAPNPAAMGVQRR